MEAKVKETVRNTGQDKKLKTIQGQKGSFKVVGPTFDSYKFQGGKKKENKGRNSKELLRESLSELKRT